MGASHAQCWSHKRRSHAHRCCDRLGARSQPFKPLQLLHSGNTLRPGTLVNPPVLVSNYTFCVIEMDAFKITPDANMYAPGSWA